VKEAARGQLEMLRSNVDAGCRSSIRLTLSTEPQFPAYRGAFVVEYRQGIELPSERSRSSKPWHYDEKCEKYPTRNFAISKSRPSDDDLCSKCERLKNAG
jgi:hypothetical protein